MQRKDYFSELKKNVIEAGICTHCGTCIGLFPNKLECRETIDGPLPAIKHAGDKISDKSLLDCCPALKLSYKKLNRFVFGKKPKSFLVGNYIQGYIGHAKDESIRRKAASGGIITSVLVYLLEKKLIDGAVVLKQGIPKPWLAKPVIAKTKEEIISCSQSVYVPVMINTILPEIDKFKGNLAYVGLPDQVAAIRNLQKKKNAAAMKIKYIIGPYVGTAIYLEAIASYLRSNKVKSIKEIKTLKYRDGEWPGYLRIDTNDGRTFKSSKFYYNYLIPFYITAGSLISVDFTNELTDISVGDAWNPKYEKKGQGFSVVLARTKQGHRILKEMEKKGLVSLEPEKYKNLVNMHGHMIDFKKRGAFIRIRLRKLLGKKAPQYDYRPKKIPLSRYLVEFFISGIFLAGRTRIARKIIEIIPLSFSGKMFNFFRKSWKKVSRSTKRKGIMSTKFVFSRD